MRIWNVCDNRTGDLSVLFPLKKLNGDKESDKERNAG